MKPTKTFIVAVQFILLVNSGACKIKVAIAFVLYFAFLMNEYENQLSFYFYAKASPCCRLMDCGVGLHEENDEPSKKYGSYLFAQIQLARNLFSRRSYKPIPQNIDLFYCCCCYLHLFFSHILHAPNTGTALKMYTCNKLPCP